MTANSKQRPINLSLVFSNFMKVEIWSDIICPFCYIGKRRFEHALSLFPQADKVQIEWKSFQLDPESTTNTSQNYAQVLAEKKNMPLLQVREMFANVAEMGRDEGLRLDFDKAIVANSLQAHRFTILPKHMVNKMKPKNCSSKHTLRTVKT